MTRLDCLIEEKEKVSGLKLLSVSLKEKVNLYYDVEIEAIQQYGAENPEVGEFE